MRRLSLWDRPDEPLEVLCLGAHSDDIEIGCAGTIQRMLIEHPKARCHWIVFSGGEGERASEARASASALLGDRAASIQVESFKDAYFPYHGSQVKGFFDDLKRRIRPDVVFTHYHADLHQDHRLLAELTWNTFRDHLILEYEIPKYDGGLGSPNVFVPLSDEAVANKVELLMSHFGSQRSNQWFSEATFRGLMRLRGIECNAPSGYAEAFYGRKCVL